MGYDCVGIGVIHFDADSFIKNVAEPVEITSPGGGIVAVIDDSAVELVDVVVSGFFDESGEFLAANAAGAIGQDFFACESLCIIFQPLRKIAKIAHIRPESAFEMAQFAFVIVPRVNQYGVFLLHRVVEIDRREVGAGRLIGIDISFVRQAEPDDFVADFDR